VPLEQGRIFAEASGSGNGGGRGLVAALCMVG
jgi:hypothetical protein